MPTAVSISPFHFGVGCHMAYVVDLQMKSMLGNLVIPLYSPNKTRLTFSFPIIVKRYLEWVESQFTLHKIYVKIQQLKEQWHSLDIL